MQARITPRLLCGALPAAIGLALGSCTVYAPMQPTIATISKAGQVEGIAGLQLNGRLEGGAVYSPVSHVLLAASGTYRPSFGDHSGAFFRTRQWEAGLGGYFPLRERLQLTGLLGYGRALTERADYYFLFGQTSSLNEARYQKVFGQVGLNYLRSRYAFGAVYRYTHVSFDYLRKLRNDRVDAVDISHAGRHEVLGFARCGFAFLPPKWQAQFSAGLSLPTVFRPLSSDEDPTGSIGRLNRPTVLLGAGLVFGSKR